MIYNKGDIIDNRYLVFNRLDENYYTETYRVKDCFGGFRFLRLIHISKLQPWQFDDNGKVIEMELAKFLLSDDVDCVKEAIDVSQDIGIIVTSIVYGEEINKLQDFISTPYCVAYIQNIKNNQTYFGTCYSRILYGDNENKQVAFVYKIAEEVNCDNVIITNLYSFDEKIIDDILCKNEPSLIAMPYYDEFNSNQSFQTDIISLMQRLCDKKVGLFLLAKDIKIIKMEFLRQTRLDVSKCLFIK